VTEFVRLRDLLEVQNGFAFASENFVKDEDGTPLIRIRDLGTRNTQVKYKGTYRDEFVVTRGDLLIGMDGDFECHRWDGPDALLNQRVCRLHNFAVDLDQNYLFHWIGRSLQKIHATTSFVTVKHISSKQILDLEIPLPPLDEQRRIVGLLDRAAEIRRRADAARAKARAIIPALFLHTFGDPATNPKGWKSDALNDLCDLVRGSSPRPQGDPRFFGGPVPRLMISDITRDGTYVTPRTDSLTIEGATRSRPMKAGDVVMAVSGAVGLPAILAIDACIHDGFVGFRNLNSKVTTHFFYYYILAIRRTSQSQAVGATFQNLNTDQIRQWMVPIPPEKHQRTFTATAQRLDSLARHLDAAAAKAEAMAAGLSAEVFG
jgi:type I restriction enzyme S subunit